MTMRETLLALVDKFFPPAIPGGYLEVSGKNSIMEAAQEFPNHNIHWPCHYKASSMRVGIVKTGEDVNKAYLRFFDPEIKENFICLLDGAARNALIDLADDLSYCHRAGKISKV